MNTATRTPAATVKIRAKPSWRWVGTGKDKQSYPGALELITGNGTHSTMVFFDASRGGSTVTKTTNGQFVLDEAARWLAKSEQRNKYLDTISVLSELTVMWGCGNDCASNSALVNVDSDLAKLKFALMKHFQQTKLTGGVVSTALWGGTAHIQTVFPERSALEN